MLGISANMRIPVGFQILQILPLPSLSKERKLLMHRIFILLLTFVAYVCYHASRKPISVVKNNLINCTTSNSSQGVCQSWISELDGMSEDKAQRLEGILDSVYLFSYAFFMFFSGIVAERVNLRYFLSLGMIFSGIFTFLFGFAKYMEVHKIAYFIIVQFFGGAFQSTGWPSVVTVVANWFGKGKKGLIFGVWNSHTSVGNILGSAVAGAFVDEDWAMSFIIPGLLITGCGLVIWMFLIVSPDDVCIDITHSTGEQSESDDFSSSRLVRNRSCDKGELTPLLMSEEIEEDIIGLLNKEKQNTAFVSILNSLNDDTMSIVTVPEEKEAISFIGALKIPGVIEFSLCLFFAKLVSYVFLYWLPTFIKETGKEGTVSSEDAAYFSILFDLGGIIGGIIAGLATDYTGKSATTCAVMLIAAIPMLFSYQAYGHSCPLDAHSKNHCYYGNIGFLVATGLLVNGPYALITTAVSAELGTHPSLQGSSKALATVTSVIDGTGSVGAAIGPFLAGAIGLNYVFYMLMMADILALVFLVRLVKSDIVKIFEARRRKGQNSLYESIP